jgi:hypothetical protein
MSNDGEREEMGFNLGDGKWKPMIRGLGFTKVFESCEILVEGRNDSVPHILIDHKRQQKEKDEREGGSGD